ncbi:hypothetical protein ASD54_04710 [Rhizobium sp. Root149]|nr:hypothetical protein ASD54_04710 [Rhizobium sp. Root149]
MAQGEIDMAGLSFDPMASYARLSERVENQGKDIIDLRSNMNTGFQTVNAGLSALSHELRTNSKTQWPVIWSAAGVCFTVLAALGTFFYGTLAREQNRLDAAIVKSNELTQIAISGLSDKVVTQKELDWRTARSAEDRARTDASIKDLQRQLDDVRQSQSAAYGPRDVIMDLRERMERIERIK